MTISILGCGWFGKALALSLSAKGHAVKGSATSIEKSGQLASLGIDPFVVNITAGNDTVNPDFFACDILVISIPPKFRQGEAGDYIAKITQIINALKKSKIGKVIYISSTGVYADSNREVDERSTPDAADENGMILLQAEHLLYNQPLFKTTVVRFAGLVGPGRHPGRFFAGKTNIPNGRAPVNLIHLDDCTGIVNRIIETDTFGIIVNATAPHHPSKADFYHNAAEQGGFTPPEFADELISWKIVNSEALNTVLNYNFKVPNWKYFTFAELS